MLPFFLEHDTGTEPLSRVEAKLAGYAQLAASTATHTPLLIHTSSLIREANLRRRIAPAAAEHHLPVATTFAAHPGQPVGGWRPLRPATTDRCTLDDLVSYWPGVVPALTDQALDGAATPITATSSKRAGLPLAAGSAAAAHLDQVVSAPWGRWWAACSSAWSSW